MIFTKKWWRAALIRALKTVAQVDWLTVAGAAALAGVVSLLTSLADLPEVEE